MARGLACIQTADFHNPVPMILESKRTDERNLNELDCEVDRLSEDFKYRINFDVDTRILDGSNWYSQYPSRNPISEKTIVIQP